MSHLIEIDNITVNYDHIEAISSLSLTVEKGDFIAIVGPNGGGKSTLIKAVLGLVKPSTGCVCYKCNNKGDKDLEIGYVPQISEINRSFPITVKEAVITGVLPKKLSLFHRYSKEDMEKVDSVLEKVGMLELKNRQIGELSGGEFKKVLIARSLLTDPDVLLLDEPNAMIDLKSQKQILELLKELSSSITIMMVTHSLESIKEYATKQYWVEKTITLVDDSFKGGAHHD